MADEREYNSIVTEARNKNLPELINNAFTKIGEEYVKAIDEELPEDLSNTPAVVAAFKRAFKRFAQQGERRIREATINALKRRMSTHEQALKQVKGSDNIFDESLSKVATDAIDDMYKRRSLDVVDSFKTVENWGGSGAMVEEELSAMVRNGSSPEKATNRIMASLASGDAEMQEAVSRFGRRGGLRAATEEPNERLQQLARRIGSDARMIARTEMSQSFLEADRRAGMRSDVVEGLKWTLSTNHTHEDICDTLATQDKYGLGSGVYPAEEFPSLPHPSCTCSSRYKFVD
ncbi:hypothetical protein [Salinibacter grassmerensis]|uniref:hypothetical protein n=1 Tax=Salinibacter grassmerensis TaxID=3040353 RepID=UPI0021E86CAB|nr:hypothetical protein [Salinibacter grassmerensis]